MPTVGILIADRLRSIRARRGESQLVVGRRAKIHRPIIGRIERGTHTVSLEVLKRICAALCVDPYEVMRVLDAYRINPKSGECTLRRRPSARAPIDLPF